MRIESNGSKWLGESPDTVDVLIDVLKNNSLDPRFAMPKKRGAPLKKRATLEDYFYRVDTGEWCAFGNFLEVSHVFRIFGTLKEMAGIRDAIAKNIATFKPCNP